MKKALGRALDSLVDRGYISLSFAEQSAENILYRNVDRIYKLGKV